MVARVAGARTGVAGYHLGAPGVRRYDPLVPAGCARRRSRADDDDPRCVFPHRRSDAAGLLGDHWLAACGGLLPPGPGAGSKGGPSRNTPALVAAAGTAAA